MTLDIELTRGRYGATLPKGRLFILAMHGTLRALGARHGAGRGGRVQVSCTFVTRGRMKALNAKWRNRDKPTDVLSFGRRDDRTSRKVRKALKDGKLSTVADPDGVVRLGEIVICPQVAKREAARFGHQEKTHILFLFVHGVLHLLGYDHERSESEARAMWKIQGRVLTEFHA